MFNMNRLPVAKRVQILSLLCEGSSMRSISRLADVSINTVTSLLVKAGKVCATFHDEHVRNVQARRVQVDEIWSYTYAKQKNVATATKAVQGAGDTWTWTGLDADSKLIISYLVGSRDSVYASAFVNDLASRLKNRIQLTSDGLKLYLDAVEDAFGGDIDYAMLVKLYGASGENETRYSPAKCLGAIPHEITGNPDLKHVSTSYVERQNLTMRMHMRRFTRLTNAFSKKLDNHVAMIALFHMHYNFARVHQTLRVTPAMEAGIADHVWDVEEIIGLLDWRPERRKEA